MSSRHPHLFACLSFGVNRLDHHVLHLSAPVITLGPSTVMHICALLARPRYLGLVQVSSIAL